MSLRLRLALWYGGLVALAVMVVSLLTYAIHARTDYEDFDTILASTAAHVSAEDAASLPPSRLVEMLHVAAAPTMVMRLYAADGKLLASSATAAALGQVDPRTILSQRTVPAYDLIAALAPSLSQGDPGPGEFGLVTEGGHRWRIYVAPIADSGRYLMVAANLAQVDASVSGLRWLLVLVGGSAILLTFWLAWLVSRRALMPVSALTETARTIERSKSFDRRVPVPGQGDELTALARTFNSMLASLEQAFRAEQRFVADASHELRAPLTAIQANLELIDRQPNMSPSDREQALGEARRESQRLARLVHDLLALARADAGLPIRTRPVEFDRVLLDAADEVRHLLKGQRMEIEHIVPVTVEGDEDRLKQLLLILLDNAVKYTPAHGCIKLGMHREDGRVDAFIQDSGVGIDAVDLPHVFERFYRADPARSRDPGGTGLGLPIAQWIAERHGGWICLKSQPGQGTTATVSLPLT